MTVYCANLCPFFFQSLSSFIKRNDILAFKELSQAASIKIGTREHEAADACSIDWLLTLLLELEGDFVFDDLLDGFRGHGSTLFFDHGQLNRFRVAEQANNEVASEEDDALA